MSDYITRYEGALIKHINDDIENKGEQLVLNRQMPNDDVHWHRGYIAALRDIGVFIQKELPKTINEG